MPVVMQAGFRYAMQEIAVVASADRQFRSSGAQLSCRSAYLNCEGLP